MQVLVIDKMHDSLVPMLAEIGVNADYLPTITRAEILGVIARYEGLIVRSKTAVDRELLEAGTRLRFVARAGAGVDQVDEACLHERGIVLLNAPEGNRDAVGEHTLGMLLMLFNKLRQADAQVRQKIWDREGNRGLEIKGKTIGIVGFGNMGQAFARKLAGFECEVLAYDIAPKVFDIPYAKQVPMSELFARADVLSVHIPLTDRSFRMMDEAYFDAFSKSIFFLNMARGEVVGLAVLAKAVQAGKIAGAALDVLENEKLQTLSPEQQAAFAYLSVQDHVLFSPHVAGWTQESYRRINEVLTQKIAALL